jgi:hypothetical protein
MGWDVVQIGLRHKLPVHDPLATAKEVAKRMKQNIRLVYRNEYKYDIDCNALSEANDYELIELGKFKVNDSNEYLQMTASNYIAYHILELTGMEKLRKMALNNGVAKSILDDIENPFELYEIEDNNESLYIRIFKENIDLDITVIERWSMWANAFLTDQYQDWLLNYRMRIYNRAKMFGCNEVIICSDQGPTEYIYNNMNLSAAEIKDYSLSLQYLNENNWLEKSEIEGWKKHAKHIMFSSYFQEQLTFSDEDFVEVVYDDFSDLIN